MSKNKYQRPTITPIDNPNKEVETEEVVSDVEQVVEVEDTDVVMDGTEAPVEEDVEVTTPEVEEAPVVTEEVIPPVVETPVVEEVVPPVKQPVVANEVTKLLSSELSLKDKLIAISKVETDLPMRSLVNKLLSYNDKMFNPMAVKPSQGAIANFDLYNVIKQAVSSTDPVEFKTKFNIINLMFLAYKDEAYNEYKLHRFDYEWKWGKESLTTYQYLVTLICILADKSTRDKELNKGILDRALDKDVVSLNDVAIQNIIKYYKA